MVISDLEGKLPDGTEVHVTIEPKNQQEFIYPIGPGSPIPAKRSYRIGGPGYVLVPDERLIR